MSAPSFGQRLQAAVHAAGPIVAGIDPHASILHAWGLPDSADGARKLSMVMLEAAEGRVAAIKPQSAFFERFGSRGVAVLEDLLASARERGVLSILDVKRGDIGSTMNAYVDSTLAPGAPLEADAITVSPYLGFGSLEPCWQHVAHQGKGVFVLGLTSNPHGPEVQHARSANGLCVAAAIARQVDELNRQHGVSAKEWGSVGLVVGATIGDAAARIGLDLATFSGAFLAPGFGAQGAGPAEARAVFGDASERVLVSMSRSVMASGPDASDLARELDRLRELYS